MKAALTALARSRWLGSAAGVALVGVTVAVRLALGFQEGDAPLAVLFVFPMVLGASLGGWPGGLAATVASALAVDYLLMAPVGSFAIARTDNRVVWLALWGVGAVVTLLVERSRRAQLRAEGREREAREVAERLRLFVEHAPAAVAMFDRQMRYLAASARYVLDYRLTTRDLIGRSHYDLLPEIPERWRELHRRCLAGAVERCEEDPFPRGDGTVDWVRWELRPWRDAAGAIGGLVLFSEVVTAAKRARDDLAEALARAHQATAAAQGSEALLRAFSDAIPDPIFVKGRDGRWIFVNPALLEVVGRHADEVLGKTDREIYSDAGIAAALMETDARIMSSGVAEVVEEQVQTPHGVRIFLSSKVPHRAATGEVIGLIGTARDITGQRRLTEQVQQSQKLESIGRLAGGVAHDFNNLLTVILSCCDTLKDDLGTAPAETREDVEQIRAAGERARDLTRQLLAFARKQVIAPVPLDLNAVVRGSEKLLGRLLGEDVTLEAALAAELWPLHADPGQLEQVIVNLALNARDAMPRGGVLRLETRNVTVTPADSPRTGDRVGEWVRLAVRDTGVGMVPEVRAHLFEPFFTTKGKGKGTGLGLATVYGIVEQAGGYVHVESEPGKGSTFELSLPRSTARAAGDGPRAPPRHQIRGTETILVAEDDPLVRGVIVRAVGAAGYRVLEAQGGREALARAAAEPGPIHLAISDVVMPGMNGRELVERLRLLRPDIRVLFVSGYSDEVVSHHGVLDSGVELLPKPFTPAALLEQVRRVLDRR